MEIESIDKEKREVHFSNGEVLTVKKYYQAFVSYFNKKICGETILPTDMERFMNRTSAKNLHLLMKGKKMEGYLEGSLNKALTPGMKIAIGTIVTLAFVGLIVLVVLNQQGILPSFS